MMENIPSISDAESLDRRVCGADPPTVVVFYREWCEDCRDLAPDISRLAEIYLDRLSFVRVDVERCAPIRYRYDIDCTPTVILFRDGLPIDRLEVELNVDAYRDSFESVLCHQDA